VFFFLFLCMYLGGLRGVFDSEVTPVVLLAGIPPPATAAGVDCSKPRSVTATANAVVDDSGIP